MRILKTTIRVKLRCWRVDPWPDPTRPTIVDPATWCITVIWSVSSDHYACVWVLGYSASRWSSRGSGRGTTGQSERTRSHWTLRTQIRSVFFVTGVYPPKSNEADLHQFLVPSYLSHHLVHSWPTSFGSGRVSRGWCPLLHFAPCILHFPLLHFH